MSAMANDQYVRRKLLDSKKAEDRARERARDRFGNEDGEKILDRAIRVTIARIQNDNPDLYDLPPAHRRR